MKLKTFMKLYKSYLEVDIITPRGDNVYYRESANWQILKVTSMYGGNTENFHHLCVVVIPPRR